MYDLVLDQHFEALLESSATDKIIEMKIDNFLTSPQGKYETFSIHRIKYIQVVYTAWSPVIISMHFPDVQSHLHRVQWTFTSLFKLPCMHFLIVTGMLFILCPNIPSIYCNLWAVIIVIIGLVLMSMQANQAEVRSVIKHHIKSLINKLSKIVRENNTLLYGPFNVLNM